MNKNIPNDIFVNPSFDCHQKFELGSNFQYSTFYFRTQNTLDTDSPIQQVTDPNSVNTISYNIANNNNNQKSSKELNHSSKKARTHVHPYTKKKVVKTTNIITNTFSSITVKSATGLISQNGNSTFHGQIELSSEITKEIIDKTGNSEDYYRYLFLVARPTNTIDFTIKNFDCNINQDGTFVIKPTFIRTNPDETFVTLELKLIFSFKDEMKIICQTKTDPTPFKNTSSTFPFPYFKGCNYIYKQSFKFETNRIKKGKKTETVVIFIGSDNKIKTIVRQKNIIFTEKKYIQFDFPNELLEEPNFFHIVIRYISDKLTLNTILEPNVGEEWIFDNSNDSNNNSNHFFKISMTEINTQKY